MPTKYRIRPLVVCQNGPNINTSVPKSLQYPATNLYIHRWSILFIFVGLWKGPFSLLDEVYCIYNVMLSEQYKCTVSCVDQPSETMHIRSNFWK